MSVVAAFLAVAAMTMLTGIGVWWCCRPGTRSGGGAIGDGMGNLIDVFEPGQARATRDLQHEQHKGPVTPTPDRDPDDPVQLVLGPGSIPRAVRIRRYR